MRFRTPLDTFRRRTAPARRAGMTLVEMTTSLVILAVILTASTSLVVVTGKAARSGADGNVGAAATAARRATGQILDDLKVATAVTERTATAVTMTVPDRDGDGAAETVRYAWSGVAGDPLYRTYNGVTGTVATDVRALSFAYLTKTVGRPPAVTSAEQSQYAHVAAAAADVVSHAVNGSTALAQKFTPTLPATATGWTVSRCRLQLQGAAGAVGEFRLSVRYADASGHPTGADVQAATAVSIAAVPASAPTWVEFAFPTPVALSTDKAVCLVLTYAGTSGGAGTVAVDANNADAGLTFSTSSGGGTGTWTTAAAGRAMQFRAYGTVTTQDRETLDFQPLPGGP